jgi:hypothetical protein
MTVTTDPDTQTQINVKRILAEARRAAPEPPPYLKTRVLAELRSRQQDSRLRVWKFFAIASGAFSVLIVSSLALMSSRTSQDGSYVAQVNDHVLIRVEVEKLQGQGVKFAEVELPPGVTFYSERYPELKDLRSVTLAWNEKMDVSRLPVVIQSSETGSKKIRIRFLGSDHSLVKEQQVTIKFAKGAA